MTDPVLSLDFAKTGRFDRRLVFARPTPARRTAASGVLRAAPPGQPRFEAGGLLVESPATNILLHSAGYDQANWTLTNCTVVPAAAVAPDGSLTAWKIVETASTTYNLMLQRNLAAEGLHTASIHLKAGERGFARLRVTNSSGPVNAAVNLADGSLLADSALDATATALGDGWYRVTVSKMLTGPDNRVMVMLAESAGPAAPHLGNPTHGLFAWGAQLEAGDAATSYVATGATAAPRAAESCTLPLPRLPRWTPAAGTLLVEAAVPAVMATPQALAALSDATGANALRLCLPGGAGVQASAVVEGSTTATLTPGSVGAGTRFRVALAWNGDGIATCLDGGAVASGDSGPPPADLTALHLGCGAGGTEHARGWLGRVVLYPERLADAALRRLTAP